MLDIVISHFNYISKHVTFTLKLIQVVRIPYLLPLEVVEKCQNCQLCVLRENSYSSET